MLLQVLKAGEVKYYCQLCWDLSIIEECKASGTDIPTPILLRYNLHKEDAFESCKALAIKDKAKEPEMEKEPGPQDTQCKPDLDQSKTTPPAVEEIDK